MDISEPPLDEIQAYGAYGRWHSAELPLLDTLAIKLRRKYLHEYFLHLPGEIPERARHVQLLVIGRVAYKPAQSNIDHRTGEGLVEIPHMC